VLEYKKKNYGKKTHIGIRQQEIGKRGTPTKRRKIHIYAFSTNLILIGGVAEGEIGDCES
jgi:hypothetical protein